jgi:hypothetical protein
MGSSSKVILIGATSLIVGVYGISLKKAETDGMKAAMKHMDRVQNERTEDAAMRTALCAFVADNGANDKSGSLTALDGSTFTYSVAKIRGRGVPDEGNYRLIVTITKDGVSKTTTSVVTRVLGNMKRGARVIHRGKFQVSKSYVSR